MSEYRTLSEYVERTYPRKDPPDEAQSTSSKRECKIIRRTAETDNSPPTSNESSLNYRKFHEDRWKLPAYGTFVPHMTLEQTLKLELGDEIDHRDKVGRFVFAHIKEKNGTKVKIHYKGWSKKWDEWSDLKNEFYKFAIAGSISKRPAHKLSHLKAGDSVDINPLYNELRKTPKLSISNFTVGQVIDAKDLYGKWYRAVIKYVKPKKQQIPYHLPICERQREDFSKHLEKKLMFIDKAAIYINYWAWGNEWNEWILYEETDMICTCTGECTAEKSFHRLAAPNTQSKWKDGVHSGWKHGEIRRIDKDSGQTEVIYHESELNRNILFWTHLDNEDEIALSCSKCKDPKITKYVFPKKREVREFQISEITPAQITVQQACQNISDVSKRFFASLSKAKYEIIDVVTLPENEIYEAIIGKRCKEGKKRNEIERYLWHGTKVSNIGLIVKNGFDRSFNRRARYGNGTYFAVRAAYCVHPRYCLPDSSGVYTLLLCKVLTGSYVAGDSKTTKIPIKADGAEYESMVNRLDNPSIFVVWRDYHAVPCNIVKFRVKHK